MKAKLNLGDDSPDADWAAYEKLAAEQYGDKNQERAKVRAEMDRIEVRNRLNNKSEAPKTLGVCRVCKGPLSPSDKKITGSDVCCNCE